VTGLSTGAYFKSSKGLIPTSKIVQCSFGLGGLTVDVILAAVSESAIALDNPGLKLDMETPEGGTSFTVSIPPARPCAGICALRSAATICITSLAPSASPTCENASSWLPANWRQAFAISCCCLRVKVRGCMATGVSSSLSAHLQQLF